MSIAVNCHCGKAFKVKNHLAGKAIRCPACKKPLRIPGTESNKGASTPGPKKSDQEQAAEAILRFEAAQRGKHKTAEEEAAYRAERNKLIESYDQLVGKSGIEKDKNGKRALAGEKRRRVTIFTKLGDAVGVVFGNLFVKYIVIMIFLSVGVIGSVYLVKFMTGYVSQQTIPTTKPKDEQIRELFKKFDADLAAEKWSAAHDDLEEIIKLDPVKENNREYVSRKEKLEKASQKR